MRVVQRAGHRGGQPLDHLDGGVEDDLGEQVLLVGEVLVEGLLGHRRTSGDLVGGRAQVAVPHEHLGSRLDDRLPPAFGPAGVRRGAGLIRGGALLIRIRLKGHGSSRGILLTVLYSTVR